MTSQLLALCFGNFIIGTGTMIVPGMLPALAEGLNVSLPVAGQLVTVFAVSIGITAPILSGATSRFDRRLLLGASSVALRGADACDSASANRPGARRQYHVHRQGARTMQHATVGWVAIMRTATRLR